MGYSDTFNQKFGQPEAEGFGFDKINAVFGEQAKQLDEALRAKLGDMDPNDTKSVIEFQVEYNKYLVLEGIRSSALKNMKDILQSIIQKF